VLGRRPVVSPGLVAAVRGAGWPVGYWIRWPQFAIGRWGRWPIGYRTRWPEFAAGCWGRWPVGYATGCGCRQRMGRQLPYGAGHSAARAPTAGRRAA